MTGYWDRIACARTTRRRLLAGAGVAISAAGAWALVACGGSTRGGTTPTPAATGSSQPEIVNPASPPRRGGRLVTANSATFGTWDPHLGIAVASAYFPRVYNVLLNQSATRPEFIFMDLAESYETPDPQTYIFHIRSGVKIAPNDLGVPERDLDAEDARISLERIRTDPTTTGYSFASAHIESLTASGSTLTVKTPGPYAWLINRIGLFTSCIAPRELLAGALSRLNDRAAGAGPFRLISSVESEVAKLDANPNYYRRDERNGGAQIPYVDGLEVRVVFERATQRVAFESGQTQLYWPANLREAQTLQDVVLTHDPAFNYISFTMNPRRPPFTDPRVRRAVSRAIDRSVYADRVYGGDAKPDGIVSWPLGAYALTPDELTQTYQPFDLDEARALANRAGGITLKMMYPANTTIQEHGDHLPIFIDQMRAAGIEVEPRPLDFGKWIDDYHALNYDCSLALNQIYETPELPLAFHTTGGPFGDHSYVQGIGDAEIDAAVGKANETLNLQERIAAVHDAQKAIYAKDPMMLPLVSPVNHFAWNKRVKDIPAGIGTSAYLVNTFWIDT